MEIEIACIAAMLNAHKELTAVDNEDGKSHVIITGPPLSPAVSQQHTDEYMNAHFFHQQMKRRILQSLGIKVLHMPANLCCSLSFSPHTPQQFQDTATIIHRNLKAYCPFLFHSGVLMTSVADLNRFLQRSQTLLPSLLIMIFLRQSIFIRYLTVGERIICRGSQPFATPKKSLNLRPSEELDLLTKWIGGGNNFSML